MVLRGVMGEPSPKGLLLYVFGGGGGESLSMIGDGSSPMASSASSGFLLSSADDSNLAEKKNPFGPLDIVASVALAYPCLANSIALFIRFIKVVGLILMAFLPKGFETKETEYKNNIKIIINCQ